LPAVRLVWVVTFLLACAMLLPVAAGAAAPANDDFDHATVLVGDSATADGTIEGATKQPGEPDHAGVIGGTSVWYRWKAPRSGLIRVVAQTNFDTLVGVYTGSAVGSLAEVGSDAKGVPDLAETHFRAVGGAEYWIAVDAAAGEGSGEFALNLENTSTQPANDNFAEAKPFTDLGGNATVVGSSEGAGRENGEPLHGGSATGASVWFSWTAHRSGATRVYPCNGSFHPLIDVYAGTTFDSLTAIGTPGNLGPGAPTCRLGGRGGVSFSAVAGQTYAIAVDGSGGDWGSFGLELIEAPLANVFPPQTFVNWQKRLAPRTMRFRFSTAEPGASFLCRLDRRPFTPCVSPLTLTRLGLGRHRFEVQGINAIGNADPSPARRIFHIVIKGKRR
jgi:hypothetical protein